MGISSPQSGHRPRVDSSVVMERVEGACDSVPSSSYFDGVIGKLCPRERRERGFERVLNHPV
jgi:hypothetical protein